MAITTEDVFDTLRQLLDPDVGINIVDLGLVAEVDVAADTVTVGLIMTTPACPQVGYLQDEAERLLRIRGGDDYRITVNVLAEPLWAPERLSESAREQLGWDE